jgi:hypothetical protein
VDRLVLIGQYDNSSGKVPGGLVDQLGAGGDAAMGYLRADYDRVSPDGPEHFPEVSLEHGAAVAAALAHGRLAVLPGTHAPPVENPDVVNTLLRWFLIRGGG